MTRVTYTLEVTPPKKELLSNIPTGDFYLKDGKLYLLITSHNEVVTHGLDYNSYSLADRIFTFFMYDTLVTPVKGLDLVVSI